MSEQNANTEDMDDAPTLTTMSPNPKGRDLRRFCVSMRGGRNYLTVAGRLVLFRDTFPGYGIDTLMLETDTAAGYAIFRAVIKDEEGRVVSTAHGSETRQDFADFAEKAETKAVGRALMFLGFGTDAAGYELDEGTRLADAPLPAREGNGAFGQGRGRGDRGDRQGQGGQAQHENPGQSNASNLCSEEGCGVTLTPGQIAMSSRAYGRPLCPAHQKGAPRAHGNAGNEGGRR